MRSLNAMSLTLESVQNESNYDMYRKAKLENSPFLGSDFMTEKHIFRAAVFCSCFQQKELVAMSNIMTCNYNNNKKSRYTFRT